MKWLHVTLIVVPSVILALLLIVIFKRCFLYKKRKNIVLSDVERSQSLQNGIARLHQVSPHHHNHHEMDTSVSENSKSYTLFDWEDHPSLINDAVENGWPQFAFTSLMTSSPSVKSFRPILMGVSTKDQRKEVKVEIGWEVSEGSVDFMQKIRLNPGMRKVTSSSTGVAVSLIRTALPLPGPRLNSSSFPQEAYFEVTILPVGIENSSVRKAKMDSEPDVGDKILLISDDFNAKNSQDSLNHVSSSSHSQGKINSKSQELKLGSKSEAILLSVGLTGGGPVPLKIPGSYSGSIGFNSTGSLYLDGIKLVPDSKGDEWGAADNTIGCGYDPSKKKVFFTINSQLVHEIHCKTEQFGYPLYPTLAANGDVMVLVNLGQSPFKFESANLQRTSNPCFVRPPGNSPALSNEDSKELFSMGRIDAHWLQRNGTRSNTNTVTSIRSLDYDMESDGELFEIVLDSIGRSPFAAPHQYVKENENL